MSYHNDTQWLSTFTLAVTSGSNTLFANGRQQVEITVGLTPQDGEEVTDEQMATIRLVTLDGDGNYQALSGELQVRAERDERFDYYPQTDATEATAALESASQRKTFYISSTRSEEVQDALYAVISQDDETHYITHGGELDAVVDLKSVAPTRLSRSDFAFWGDDIVDESLSEAGVDCDIYHLCFNDPQLRIAASIAQGASDGDPYYQNHLDISPGSDSEDEADTVPTLYQNFTHFAYEVGEEKTCDINGAAVPVNQIPGIMNFIRLKTTSDQPEADPRHEVSRWDIVDQYGNVHTLEMTQTGEGNSLDFILSDAT